MSPATFVLVPCYAATDRVFVTEVSQMASFLVLARVVDGVVWAGEEVFLIEALFGVFAARASHVVRA